MIRIAIIGTGNIAHAHMQAYRELSAHCCVVALVDIIPGKAAAFAEEFGLSCPVYENYAEILDSEEIDLADICTPPFVHARASIDFLHAGKNVVCEKPMASSLEECDAMLRARDESGKKLAIIAQNRFKKPIRDLKALLDSGIAGPVRHAAVNSYWWRGHCYYDLWWRGTWEKEGGGCTLNHAVHHIDMLLYMMGRPEVVTAVLANTAHDNAEVEDLSVSILEYPHALASLTASVVHHKEEQEVIFQCEKAKIAAPFDTYASVSLPNGFPEEDPVLEEKIKAFCDALPPLPYEGHTGELYDVLQAIQEDREPAIGGEDGRRTIELITAIYKAGALKERVFLPLTEDDPFYTVEGIMEHVPHFYEKTASELELSGKITVGSDYR